MASVGRHAAIYAVGTILSKGIGFLMLPIYTRFLTPADYGVLALIEMTLEVVSILAGAQLAMGVFRFYHKADTEKERNSVVSTALLAIGLSYGAVGVGAFAAAPLLGSLVFGHTEHVLLIRIAALGMIAQSLPTVPLAYARVRDFSGLVVGTGLVRLVLALTLNIILLAGFGLGVKAILISTLISNTLIGVWLVLWTTKRVGLTFSRDATRDLVRYGAPLVATHVAAFVMTFGDRFFLQAAADSTAVGLYNLAYQFGFLLFLLGYSPFDMVWGPKRFAIARRPDRDQLLARAFVYLNILLIGCAVMMSLFVGDLLRIMTTPAFHPAAAVVPVILVAYVLQAWSCMQDIGILLAEKTEYVTLANWTGAAVSIAGYMVLVPRFLAWGAAFTVVLAFLTRWLITYAASQRLSHVRYDWAPIVRLTVLAAVTVGASMLLPPLPLLASIAVRLMLAGAFCMLLWVAGILTVSERAYVVAVATRLTRRVLRRELGTTPA